MWIFLRFLSRPDCTLWPSLTGLREPNLSVDRLDTEPESVLCFQATERPVQKGCGKLSGWIVLTASSPLGEARLLSSIRLGQSELACQFSSLGQVRAAYSTSKLLGATRGILELAPGCFSDF
jgi:hypothetical protein